MTRYLLILVLCLAPAFMPVSAAEVQEDPLERQMLDIAKDLRCTVCQNQPVSESNADMARDMRDIIREQLAAGKSREEIVAYFVDRYGNYVLLEPRFDPLGAVLWVAPALLLAGIGIFAYLYMVRRVKPIAPADIPALSPEDQARVQAARQRDQA